MKLLTIVLLLCGYSSLAQVPEKNSNSTNCNIEGLRTIILDKYFNSIPQYDTLHYSLAQFDDLPYAVRTMLWYRDIENTSATQFTPYWSGPRYQKVKMLVDSADNKPKSSNSDHPFLDQYFNRNDIELAFQLGPYIYDLSADCYYVVKRLDDCFLITRSYFRHARFTYKSYALVNKHQLDSLYTLLGNFKRQSLTGGLEGAGLTGHFADNRNKKKYFIDFQKEAEPKTIINNYDWKPNKESQEFYDFLDKHVNWTVTYQL
jgi:hypothetical protein